MGRVLFRCDASSTIGVGHAVRCAALANALKAQGHDTLFLCRAYTGNACDWLINQGHRVLSLPAQSENTEIEDISQLLVDTPRFDWLIIDHYSLPTHIEIELRRYAEKVLVIDDAANRMHDCDILLDQNIDSSADKYAPFVPAHTRLLIGSQYALLRPEFRRARAQIRQRSGAIRNILVCYGGSDPGNHTLATIKALTPHISRVDRVNVVIGSANPHASAIKDSLHNDSRWHIHHPASSMIELMLEADLSIGAGGTMTWERACLGLPSLAFGIVDNQRNSLIHLIRDAIVIGDPEMLTPDIQRMSAWIEIAFSAPQLIQGIGLRSAQLVDGAGCERVVNHLFPTDFTFRPANDNDCHNLFLWRNHPSIRAQSADSTEIPWEQHKNWFASTINRPDCHLLIAEIGTSAAGVVRFDIRKREAIISVYRIPDIPSLGHRLVDSATQWFRTQHPEIDTIHATVLANNTASRHAFQAAGYTLEHQLFSYRHSCYD